jgi:hypothetical protein
VVPEPPEQHDDVAAFEHAMKRRIEALARLPVDHRAARVGGQVERDDLVGTPAQGDDAERGRVASAGDELRHVRDRGVDRDLLDHARPGAHAPQLAAPGDDQRRPVGQKRERAFAPAARQLCQRTAGAALRVDRHDRASRGLEQESEAPARSGQVREALSRRRPYDDVTSDRQRAEVDRLQLALSERPQSFISSFIAELDDGV